MYRLSQLRRYGGAQTTTQFGTPKREREKPMGSALTLPSFASTCRDHRDVVQEQQSTEARNSQNVATKSRNSTSYDKAASTKKSASILDVNKDHDKGTNRKYVDSTIDSDSSPYCRTHNSTSSKSEKTCEYAAIPSNTREAKLSGDQGSSNLTSPRQPQDTYHFVLPKQTENTATSPGRNASYKRAVTTSNISTLLDSDDEEYVLDNKYIEEANKEKEWELCEEDLKRQRNTYDLDACSGHHRDSGYNSISGKLTPAK